MLGAAAAAWMLPGELGPALADVPHGPPVSRVNPIQERIQLGDRAVNLVPVVQLPKSRSTKPFTMINCMVPVPGKPGRALVADARTGIVRLINLDARKVVKAVLNVKAVRAGLFASIDKANGDMRGGGLRCVCCDPEFSAPGAPGFGVVYTIHLEFPSAGQGDVRVFHGDGSRFPVNFHNVVTAWRILGTDWTTIDTASYREIMRIAVPNRTHNADTVLFDPTRIPGGPGFGLMHIGVGDGLNQPSHPDPYDVAQDLGSPLGKFLRIVPPCRAAGARYGVPSANPLVGNGLGWLPEIIEWGLRHPQSFWFDPANGRRYVTDIGQYHVESLRWGGIGRNHGWPLREGTFVTDRAAFDETVLYERGPNDAGMGFSYPLAQYDHKEGLVPAGAARGSTAITGGVVGRGAVLNGVVVFGEMTNGRIFFVPVADIVRAASTGVPATIRELRLYKDNIETSLKTLVDGRGGRVDSRFGYVDGRIFVMSKQNGWIYELRTRAA
jgi:hypothetical protein